MALPAQLWPSGVKGFSSCGGATPQVNDTKVKPSHGIREPFQTEVQLSGREERHVHVCLCVSLHLYELEITKEQMEQLS